MTWKIVELETRPQDIKPKITSILANPVTNTFEFVLDPKGRSVPETLTLEDRRELAKTGLRNQTYFEKAKQVYARGGGIKEIWLKCGNSVSYAEKVHAAFEKACK